MSSSVDGAVQAHSTVLLTEAVEALVTDPQGFYVDGTFGRGGHSAALLAQLKDAGQLLAIDRDPEAIKSGNARFRDESRIQLEQSEFSQAKELVGRRGEMGNVCGLLFDLGVSSPQINSAERGFSFMQDGPLDMRMSAGKGMSAADWLNTADLEDIVRVLKVYGEERFARRIATAVLEKRAQAPLETTRELVDLIDQAIPVKDPHKHPATRSFQAIRIHINAELDEIEKVLVDSIDMLSVGGRLVVISFHSLEDRIVKRFMRDHSRPLPVHRDLPVTSDQMSKPPLRILGKAIKPGREEILSNPRARSAVMRVAEKVA